MICRNCYGSGTTPGRDMQPVPCEQCADEPVAYRLDWPAEDSIGRDRFVGADRKEYLRRAKSYGATLVPLYTRPAEPQPAAGADEQDARRAFEAWAKGPAGYIDNQLDRYADGGYQDSTTCLHWSIWRKAWSAAIAAQEKQG